jgi:hypothetical protein
MPMTKSELQLPNKLLLMAPTFLSLAGQLQAQQTSQQPQQQSPQPFPNAASGDMQVSRRRKLSTPEVIRAMPRVAPHE